MRINSFSLNSSSVISNDNCIASSGVNGNFIIPNWKTNASDDIYRGDGVYANNGYPTDKTYRGSSTGDRPISPEQVFIDTDCGVGDLVITSGWSTGLGIRRVNSTGTPELLYGRTYFGRRYDTRYGTVTAPSSQSLRDDYHHISSMAVDTVNKKIYMGTAWTSNCGLIEVDYSGFKTSDAWHELPCQVYLGRENWSDSQVGSHYFNGLAIAGDWLYFTSYSTYAQGATRWNTKTHERQELPELNRTSGQMRRGHIWYDAPRDRIFVNSFYGNVFHVVLNASSDTNAESINIGQFSENRGTGFVLDDDNPNIVYNLTNNRVRKIDITPALAKEGTSGTQLAEYYFDGALASGYLKLSAPTGTSSFMQIIADRGWHRNNSYVDLENNRVVGLLRDASGASISDYRFTDYGNWTRRVKSTNGTYFDLRTGYGWHGHTFDIWNDGEGTGFEENANITFGTYALDNDQDITDVYLAGMETVSKAGTSLSVQVSNNNGSSWEAYNSSLHEFSSVGNRLRVKFTFNNPSDRASYIWGVPVVVPMELGRIKRGIYKARRAFKSRRNWIRRR